MGSGGIGAITYSELRSYLHFYPQADERRWVEIMKRLDAEYLATQRELRKRREQAEKGTGNSV